MSAPQVICSSAPDATLSRTQVPADHDRGAAQRAGALPAPGGPAGRLRRAGLAHGPRPPAREPESGSRGPPRRPRSPSRAGAPPSSAAPRGARPAARPSAPSVVRSARQLGRRTPSNSSAASPAAGRAPSWFPPTTCSGGPLTSGASATSRPGVTVVREIAERKHEPGTLVGEQLAVFPRSRPASPRRSRTRCARRRVAPGRARRGCPCRSRRAQRHRFLA